MGIMCEKCNQCATFVALFDSYLSIVDIIMPFHHFWLSCPKINGKKCHIQNKGNKNDYLCKLLWKGFALGRLNYPIVYNFIDLQKILKQNELKNYHSLLRPPKWCPHYLGFVEN
jgi:hypothetical protein